MKSALALLLCLLVVTSGTAEALRGSLELPEIDRLVGLILYRLDLAEPVAAWKWRHDKPIEDLAQEHRALDAAMIKTGVLGLDPPTVRPFLVAQIEASKAAQRAWFSRWRSRGFPTTQPDLDLDTKLRPAIACVSDNILIALAQKRPQLDRPAQRRRLSELLRVAAERRGFSPRPLVDIARKASGIRYADPGTATGGTAVPQSTGDCRQITAVG
jgi:chorismate mutase